MVTALSLFLFVKQQGKSAKEAWEEMDEWFQEHRKNWGKKFDNGSDYPHGPTYP